MEDGHVIIKRCTASIFVVGNTGGPEYCWWTVTAFLLDIYLHIIYIILLMWYVYLTFGKQGFSIPLMLNVLFPWITNDDWEASRSSDTMCSLWTGPYTSPLGHTTLSPLIWERPAQPAPNLGVRVDLVLGDTLLSLWSQLGVFTTLAGCRQKPPISFFVLISIQSLP